MKLYRNTFTLSLIAALLSGAGLFASDGPTHRKTLQAKPEPVPSKWLLDGRLVVPEYNFSLEPPKPGSQWSYQALPDIEGKKATFFIADDSEQEHFVMLVWEAAGRMSSADTKKFIDGMQETLPKDWKAQGVVIEPSTVPASDSVKFKSTIKLPNHSTLYAYGYIHAVPGTRTFMFLAYSAETTENPNFARFVSSFKLIQSSKVSSFGIPEALAVVALILFQGVLLWFSIRAKPIGNKPYRCAYVAATIVLFLLRVAVGIWISNDIPYSVGDAMGTTFLGVTPSIIYWYISGRREQNGKLRTVRVMFWGALILPALVRTAFRQT